MRHESDGLRLGEHNELERKVGLRHRVMSLPITEYDPSEEFLDRGPLVRQPPLT